MCGWQQTTRGYFILNSDPVLLPEWNVVDGDVSSKEQNIWQQCGAHISQSRLCPPSNTKLKHRPSHPAKGRQTRPPARAASARRLRRTSHACHLPSCCQRVPGRRSCGSALEGAAAARVRDERCAGGGKGGGGGGVGVGGMSARRGHQQSLHIFATTDQF
jgi:hypothetical protein